MNSITQIEIEHACTTLTRAFAYHMDRSEFEAVAALFSDDGVWIRNGVTLQGSAQILATLRQRPASQIARHVTCSTHFTEVGETTAQSVSYNLTCFSPGASELPARYAPDNVVLLDFNDTFVKTSAGWRIQRRDSPVIMLSDSVRAMMSGHK